MLIIIKVKQELRLIEELFETYIPVKPLQYQNGLLGYGAIHFLTKVGQAILDI